MRWFRPRSWSRRSRTFPTNVDVGLSDSILRFVTKDSIKDFVYLDWVTVAKNREAWTKAYDAAVKE